MESPIASWQWKVEPVSPPFVAVENEADTWLLDDDLTHFSSPASLEEEKPLQPTRAQVASKLLDELDEWIKEEPFSDWLEEKINLPIFEDLLTVESNGYHNFSRGNNEAVRPLAEVQVKGIPLPLPQVMVTNDTQALLQEFESVYGEVEQNNSTLTPPQSPTLPSYQNVLTQDNRGGQLLITNLQQLVPIFFQPKKDPLVTLEQMVPVATVVPDVARELADVDELVRTCVEDLETSSSLPAWGAATSSADSNSSDLPSFSPPSPCTSSNSSFESSDELADDSEWIPSLQSPAPGHQNSGGRKRSKPYARAGQEDKRKRKKEQNKNAATRYRQKKKAEIEVILSEEKGLEDKNGELHQKVSDLAREIKYLKGLMRDVFRAKGLIK